MDIQTSDFTADNVQAQLDANPSATTVYIAPDLWPKWTQAKAILDGFHATYPPVSEDENLNAGEWYVA